MNEDGREGHFKDYGIRKEDAKFIIFEKLKYAKELTGYDIDLNDVLQSLQKIEEEVEKIGYLGSRVGIEHTFEEALRDHRKAVDVLKKRRRAMFGRVDLSDYSRGMGKAASKKKRVGALERSIAALLCFELTKLHAVPNGIQYKVAVDLFLHLGYTLNVVDAGNIVDAFKAQRKRAKMEFQADETGILKNILTGTGRTVYRKELENRSIQQEK